jgi:hypothetical protein
MPYNYRSTLTLSAYNSLQAGPFTFSTPYTGVFTASYSPFKASQTCTIQSTIGFPFKAAGSRGTGTPIQTFTEGIYTVSIAETNATTYSGDAYLSSLSFNLAPYSSIIDRDAGTSILLNYSPSFLLSPYQTVNPNTDSYLTSMSTFLVYGANTLVPGTAVETVFYSANTPPLKNPIYPSLQIDIPKSFVNGNYKSNYYVYHYFPGLLASSSNVGTWPPTWTTLQPGLSTNKAVSLTGINNMAIVSVIGL